MTSGHRSAFAPGRPARGGPARSLVGIGQVLEELRPEFPDISPSKIRFLEAEGLIAPERASSGYRRFAVADIERLRFILTAQRDEYLPLRVIKERLDALSGDGGGRGGPGVAPAVALTRSGPMRKFLQEFIVRRKCFLFRPVVLASATAKNGGGFQTEIGFQPELRKKFSSLRR